MFLFGPVRIKLLINYFGSAKKFWKVTRDNLQKTGLTKKLVDGFIKYRTQLNSEAYFLRLNRLSIKTITYRDSYYPKNLVDLEDAPIVLYIKGKVLESDVNAISIVGSRKLTSYGKEVARMFASELANLGITIVSGLARGIDTVAHKAALEVGGRTIAALPCGLDTVYPAENTLLAKRIVKSGAILSEYPLGYPVFRSNFALRNRIISGLSQATIVIQGEKRSGTLLTATNAANQGRTLFAAPGEITFPLSSAPNTLIQKGAKMVTQVNDVLEDLDLQLMVDQDRLNKVMPGSKDEEKIVKVLSSESLHLDEIARISGFHVSEVSARLSIMELKGLVINLGSGVYRKV